MKAMILFPNQLFVETKADYHYVYLEDDHFFSRLPFHKHKLVLHRASFKAHFDTCNASKIYFDYPVNLEVVNAYLNRFVEIFAYDPIEHLVIEKYKHLGIRYLDSPNFLTTKSQIYAFFKDKKRYFMHDFYVFQRNRTGILMEGNHPLAGHYSFDTDNRKKLPKNRHVQVIDLSNDSVYIQNAKTWVNQTFKHHPGNTDDFKYPIDRVGVKQLLEDFIFYKLVDFGPYQDAMDSRDPYLFHSNLSAAINIGLISPHAVIDAVTKSDIPMASKEGFVRQILGWREFVRALYVLEGDHLFGSNQLKHHNQLSDAWHIRLGIPVVDQVIQKLNHYAYAHHIERLMVLGNLMMMLNVHPKEVYRYFSIYSLDAYDWVMIPNIFGMSQYAALNLMTTKPYFSGSNYMLKMGADLGNYAPHWDALFYLFLRDHRSIIDKNPRLKMLTGHLSSKTNEELLNYERLKKELISIAIKGEYHD